jgi:phosphoribosylformylglycinamidine synthase
VLGNTALAMPDDAGVVRVDEETGRGVAVATDCNGRFGALDPYAGRQLALAEAVPQRRRRRRPAARRHRTA